MTLTLEVCGLTLVTQKDKSNQNIIIEFGAITPIHVDATRTLLQKNLKRTFYKENLPVALLSTSDFDIVVDIRGQTIEPLLSIDDKLVPMLFVP